MYEKKNKRRDRMTAIEKVIRRFYNGKLQIDRDIILKLINNDIPHLDNNSFSSPAHSRIMMRIDPSFKEEKFSQVKDSDLINFYMHKKKKDRYMKTVICLEINDIGTANLNMFEYVVFSQPLTMEEFVEVKQNIDAMIEINNMINGIMKKSITTSAGLSKLSMRDTPRNVKLIKLLELNDKLSEDIRLLIELQTW
jgi:hypothetical protein